VTQSPEVQSTTAGDAAITQQLARIWENTLGLESIGSDQNYFDLGGDSSLAVQMFAQIEKIFGVRLPLATLYEAPTIAELALLLRSEAAPSGWSSLVAIQPSGSRPPLFCFHGAGGTVFIYHKLSRYLAADQPLYGVQSRGLDGSCAPLTRIEDMAAVYVDEIRRVQPQGPYFLAGYCMGGTVAYEVAQQLHAAGESIALLALFDTMNWHKIPLTFWSKSSHACQQWMFHAASFLNLNFSGKAEFFKEKAAVLRNRVPVWRGMLLAKLGRKRSASVAPDWAVLGNIWQTNDRAAWSYIPKPYPGTIVDFRPAKQYRVFDKPDLKWDRLAQEGQQVVVLPINPASMLVEPFVKHLAVALRAFMDDAIKRWPSGKSREVAQSR